jgi:hypothetical protein
MFRRFTAPAALVLLCGLFFTACYMSARQRIVYYPDVPDALYPIMKATLMELGYTITMDEPMPAPLLTPDPFIVGAKGQLKIMATFKRIQAETQVEINASQIGAKIADAVLDRARDEVTETFARRVKEK